MQHLLLTVVCACLLSLWPPPPALTPRLSVTIDDRGVTLDFPHSLTFAAHVAAPAGVERVTLEYGVDQLTCGEVTARAIPPVTPGAAAEVEWTWDMRQSGAPPPGAQIWYRWRVRDTDGAEHVSPEQRVTWLDQQHRWRQVSSGAMTLHWYEGPQAFAEELLAASAGALARLEDEIGLRPGAPVDLYIYHSMEDLRAAVLYEPGWTGGLAYASHNIVIMGIHPDNVAWGKRITAHELTHVLVGHMAFSCLGSIPTWLNEGIAVYGEGGPEPAQAQQLEDAIRADRLLSVRALSGNFAEDADRANLSYTQSYSLVRFLIDEYGRERLLEVFGRLRRGATIDDALEDVYGFGVEGLEDRWRAAVGARLRQEAGAALTATPAPSPVPTYAPIAGAPVAPDQGTAEVTPAAAPTATQPAAQDGAPARTPAVPPVTGRAESDTNALAATLPLAAGIVAGIALAAGALVLWRTRRKQP